MHVAPARRYQQPDRFCKYPLLQFYALVHFNHCKLLGFNPRARLLLLLLVLQWLLLLLLLMPRCRSTTTTSSTEHNCCNNCQTCYGDYSAMKYWRVISCAQEDTPHLAILHIHCHHHLLIHSQAERPASQVSPPIIFALATS